MGGNEVVRYMISEKGEAVGLPFFVPSEAHGWVVIRGLYDHKHRFTYLCTVPHLAEWTSSAELSLPSNC